MSAISVEIDENNNPNPDVLTMMSYSADISSIEISISPYVRSGIDLSSNYCRLMTTVGNWTVKKNIQYVTSGNTLTATWNVDDEILNNENIVSYKISFITKGTGSIVWQTNPGTLLTRENIPGDEFVAGFFVGKIKQINDFVRSLSINDIFAYKWMPVGSWILPSLRKAGRIYLNLLSKYCLICIFEGSKGETISPDIKSISYYPHSNNDSASIKKTLSSIAGKTIGNVPFCVNDGHVNNAGGPDILDFSDDEISFKIGSENGDMAATLADGTTFKLSQVQPMSCSSLEDGEYTVFVGESGSAKAIKSTIYRQVSEPIDASEGDIWYNASIGMCKILKNGKKITKGMPPSNHSFIDAGYDSTAIFALTNSNIFRSIDGGYSWETVFSRNGLFFCRKCGNKFISGGIGGALFYTSNYGDNWEQCLINCSQVLSCACFDGSKYYSCTSCGKIYSSNDLATWEECADFLTDGIYDICCKNGIIIAGGTNGKIFKSTDGTTWAAKQSNIKNTIKRIRWLDNGTIVACSTVPPFKIATSSDNGETWESHNIRHVGVFDCCYLNDEYVFATEDGVFCGIEVDNLSSAYNGKGIYRVIAGDVAFGKYGSVAKISDVVGWIDFHSIPVGTATISDGSVSEVSTARYNWNGTNVISETVATDTSYGVIRTASCSDEKNEHCFDAAFTPENAIKSLNYRLRNTEYSLGDMVACQYHDSIVLKCTTAGVTSNGTLDTDTALEIGDEIQDGNVTWTVSKINDEIISNRGDMVAGNSNGAPSRLPIGAIGQSLKVGDGSIPVWSSRSSSGMENPMTTAGDIIVGGTSGNPSRLGIGNSGDVLKVSSGGNVSWGNIPGGMENPMTTAGDIIVGGTSGNPSRLGIGMSGSGLTVNSTADGLEWGDVLAVDSQTLDAGGYVKLGNGMIIQWGYFSHSSHSSKIDTITFPVAFSNQDYAFSGIIGTNTSGTDSHLFLMSENERTTTTISVVRVGANIAMEFNRAKWMAVGY